jgi:hypothetical protein
LTCLQEPTSKKLVDIIEAQERKRKKKRKKEKERHCHMRADLSSEILAHVAKALSKRAVDLEFGQMVWNVGRTNGDPHSMRAKHAREKSK